MNYQLPNSNVTLERSPKSLTASTLKYELDILLDHLKNTVIDPTFNNTSILIEKLANLNILFFLGCALYTLHFTKY